MFSPAYSSTALILHCSGPVRVCPLTDEPVHPLLDWTREWMVHSPLPASSSLSCPAVSPSTPSVLVSCVRPSVPRFFLVALSALLFRTSSTILSRVPGDGIAEAVGPPAFSRPMQGRYTGADW